MTLQLKNIGMIKEASVKIDGLTVIAGENDTGKSTVGKALYVILKTASNDNFSIQENLMLHYMQIIFGGSFFHINQKLKIQLTVGNDIYSYQYKYKYPSDCDKVLYNWKWTGEKRLDKDIIFIETPLVWSFTDFFRDISQIESQMNIKVDYPPLMKDLNFKLHIKSASNGLNIKKQMTNLMGGEFKKDEMGHYYFDKNGEKIELVNTATGIKTFGLFQILSQNNYLNENMVLILDEPEVHLHPKWQLEMAKVIVNLVKNKVKVVVNSHSPYMIDALKYYAEELEVNSNFYLAEKNKDETSIIKDVTMDISPIFEKLTKPLRQLRKMKLGLQ